MRTILAALLAAATTTSAGAADAPKPMTVLTCLNVLGGLDALSYAGKQLNTPASQPAPADAKQYKLGPLRVTIALDISRLQDLANTVQRAQNGYAAELPALDPKSPDAVTQRTKQLQDNWNKITDADCPVQPGRLKQADLKIGDGPDDNAFPPAVLGALMPIIDP